MLALALALALSAEPSGPTLVPPDEVPLERMSLSQLHRAQLSLEDARPPLLGPIFMLTSGGVMLGGGAYFGFLALLGLFGGATWGNAAVVLGLLLGGSGFLTGGILFLRTARAERAGYDEQIDAIQQEIERRRGGLTVVAF